MNMALIRKVFIFILLGISVNILHSDAVQVKTCAAQYVNTFELQICPFGSEQKITVSIAGQSSLAVAANDSCPSDPADCTQDNIGDVAALQSNCDRSIVCSPFLAQLDPILCDGSLVGADYLITDTTCEVAEDAYRYSVTCQNQEINNLRCPTDHHIKVVQAFFADTGTGACESHNPSDYQCLLNMTQMDPVYYQSIQTACDDKPVCDAGVMAQSFPVDECSDNTNVNTNNVLIGYVCAPVVKSYSACSLKSFDGLTCSDGFLVNVISAWYVDVSGSLTVEQCDNLTHTNHCLSEISSIDSAYYADIIDKCQDQQACEGLVASSGSIGFCYPNERPDYVRIYYECLVGSYTEPPITSMTAASDTTGPPGVSSVSVTSSPDATSSAIPPAVSPTATTSSPEVTSGTNVPGVSTVSTSTSSGGTTSSTNGSVSDVPTVSRVSITTSKTVSDSSANQPTDGVPTTVITTQQSTNLGLIIGLVIGGLILLVVIITAVCLLVRRGSSKNEKAASTYQDPSYMTYNYPLASRPRPSNIPQPLAPVQPAFQPAPNSASIAVGSPARQVPVSSYGLNVRY